MGLRHLGQTVHDGGLADAGFAAHKGNAPRTAYGLVQVTGEVLEHSLSLQ
nr:hypothetical protein StreXyl84_60630 [Streptomyces sp. Xyl84]